MSNEIRTQKANFNPCQWRKASGLLLPCKDEELNAGLVREREMAMMKYLFTRLNEVDDVLAPHEHVDVSHLFDASIKLCIRKGDSFSALATKALTTGSPRDSGWLFSSKHVLSRFLRS